MHDNAQFRLLDTGSHAGALNMALDEAILIQVAKGESPPTIRFFSWERPTVTVGYFQRLEREIDVQQVAAAGFDLVRRMTGGRAVLHDQELTYSVIVPGRHAWAQASVVESYRLLSQGLRDGFLRLGVAAEVVSLADEKERAKFTSPGSAACFDSPSWYELVVGGKKIAGSAQVRAHDGLLQHGSLLLDLNPDDLFRVLRFRSDEERKRMLADFLERAVSVRQLTGRKIAYAEAAAAFAEGFASGLGISLQAMPVTDKEWELALQLETDKYRTEGWNHRR